MDYIVYRVAKSWAWLSEHTCRQFNMSGILLKEKNTTQRHRHTGRCYVITEAESRVMQLQTKGCQGLQPLLEDTGKGKIVSPCISEGAWLCLRVDFRLLSSRTVKH